jgi:hypothetical protein
VRGGDERPDEAGGGQAVVLHSPVGDRQTAAGGSGDGGGVGVCLKRAGVGEASSVVADLSPGHIAEAGEAGDDLVVGVLGKRLGCGLTELVDAGALGVQGSQQAQGLGAHRLFHHRVLAQLRAAQRLVEPGGELVGAAFAASSSSAQRRSVAFLFP